MLFLFQPLGQASRVPCSSVAEVTRDSKQLKPTCQNIQFNELLQPRLKMYYQYYDPPPSPEPLESGVFTYGKDGIKAGGFTRAHSAVTSLRNPFSGKR